MTGALTPAKKDLDTEFQFEVSRADRDQRLDLFLASRSLGISRSRIQELIRRGGVAVNQGPSRAGYRTRAGDRIRIAIPPPSPSSLDPEPVDFNIIHEDASILVVNKPPGLVVHPAAGHVTGTLVHGLLWHCRDLSGIGGVARPGIVHRLDKDTSGLMVVAKNDRAHAELARQFKSGEVRKEYQALVNGKMQGSKGKIDLPIGRNPRRRKEMAVALGRGKGAITLWWLSERFESGFSLVSVSIKTGRTHQIRVHFANMGHPVVGDRVYGYGTNWWKGHPLWKKGWIPLPQRQMLHAGSLGFHHPETARFMTFEVPVPGDMEELIRSLRTIESRNEGLGQKSLTMNRL
jgi:23S rRNA pseudouridine1911/1915/1917 synthase